MDTVDRLYLIGDWMGRLLEACGQNASEHCTTGSQGYGRATIPATRRHPVGREPQQTSGTIYSRTTRSGVARRPEHETLGGRRVGSGLPLPGGQHGRNGIDGHLTSAHGYQRADHRTDHSLAER